MRPLDDIVRTMPPDAVELRAVRFQVRPTAGESAGDWLSDAILGSESSPADGPRPLSIRELHWLTATGGTVLIRLDQRERVEPDDLARLMGAARRRGLRFAIWSQGGTDLRPQMVLTEVWFTGHPPPPDPSAGRVRARVEETVTPTGTTVTIEERIGRQPLWLLMLPLLVLSFAWVFFLVLGALPKMVRDIWQRGARGVRQQTTVSVDTDRIGVHVVRNGGVVAEVDLPRERVVAVGTRLGFVAYTADGAVALPAAWATTDPDERAALTRRVAALLNRAIGAE